MLHLHTVLAEYDDGYEVLIAVLSTQAEAVLFREAVRDYLLSLPEDIPERCIVPRYEVDITEMCVSLGIPISLHVSVVPFLTDTSIEVVEPVPALFLSE